MVNLGLLVEVTSGGGRVNLILLVEVAWRGTGR